MSITGIIGGRGTGKTLSMVYLAREASKKGKKLYTNFKIKLPATYLTKEWVGSMLEKVKEGSINLKNSCVLIDEMHNYMDSRTAMSKKNRALSYWIAQSRHTGHGSCEIYYTTQFLNQVDLRLRNNTDYLLKPVITEKIDEKPSKIQILGSTHYLHRIVRFGMEFKVFDVLELYDTYEIIDF